MPELTIPEGYTVPENAGPGLPVLICEKCGVLIHYDNTKPHNLWHERLRRAWHERPRRAVDEGQCLD